MKKKRFYDRCWEHMRCGEEQQCSAYPDCGYNCWEVAGTMRNSQSERRMEQLYQRARESGRDVTEQDLLMFKPVKPMKLCKFIERYGMCQCCPYYQHVEKMEKASRTRNSLEF